jgi:acyl-CoA thioesterase FadM
MESIGYAFAPLIRNSEYLLPIVHAEADYMKPLATGDRIEIQLKAEKIGNSSFTLAYALVRNRTELVGTVRTVHVLTNRHSGESVSIVPELRRHLEAISQ